jgi:SAM-dependent methyltransferase
MSHSDDFGVIYATEQLRRSHHPLRKIIKSFYLENILRDIKGKTIDFGCGAGQLLARLPAGSVGLEVNPHLVAALRKCGLNSQRYDDGDDFSFLDFPCGYYKTLVMAHVLEHFHDADKVLRKILNSCSRIGIERAIIVVPGAKGYSSDQTHQTFVNANYLKEHGLLNCEGYAAMEISYFPVNHESIGKYFPFHELKLIYEKTIIRH